MFDGNRPSARLIGGALVGVMVLGSALGAEAATKKKVKKPVKVTRTVTLTYNGGCSIETPAVVGSLTSSCGQFGAAGWAVPTKAAEKFATITVKDATGRGVPGAFWEGSGTNSTTTDFCGALKNYVVPAGGSVKLALDAIGGRQSCPGTATHGTITIAFSNLP
jgi:hypothetical protein